MLKRALSRLVLTAILLLIGLGVYFYIKPSVPPGNPSSVSPKRTTETVQAPQFVNATSNTVQKPSDEMARTNENDVLRPIPLGEIPGGSLVMSKQTFVTAPIRAEGLADLLVDAKLTDEKKAEALARVAMNPQEDPEVRQEALDQWLRFIPEEGEALLSTLARDSRITSAMAAILIKDTFTRTISIQAEVALISLAHNEAEIRQLAREQLIALTGIDHKDNKNAWAAEIKNLLSRQPKN